MDDIALMYRFLTLGEDCEFSFIQRRAGAEPMEMLRFSSSTLIELIAAFETKFEAIGDPAFTAVSFSNNELWGTNTRHNFNAHHLGENNQQDLVEFKKKYAKKMAFQRRIFLEDLEEGKKTLVFKRLMPIRYYSVHALYKTIRAHSACPLLWVVEQDRTHPPGAVEALGGGFFKGHVDKFAPAGRARCGSLDIWMNICRETQRLIDSSADMSSPEPPPPHILNPARPHSWVATEIATLRSSLPTAPSFKTDPKIDIKPGDIVEAKNYVREGGRLKLIDAALNGQPIDGLWFIYPPHWTYDLFVRGGDAHD